MLLVFCLTVPWLGRTRLPVSLAGVPTPVGGLLIPAAGFAIGAVTFSSRSVFRSLRSFILPVGSVLAVALLGLLQLTPLPEPALRQIASVNLQIYHETAELLSLYGQSAPAPRVSLGVYGTAATVLRLGGYAALFAAAAHLLRTRLRRRVFSGILVASGALQIVVAGVLAATAAAPFRGAFASDAELSDFLLVLLPVAFGLLWAEVLTNSERARDTVDRGDRLAQRLSPLVSRALSCLVLGVGIVLAGSFVSLAAGAIAVALGFLLATKHPAARRGATAAAAIGFMAAPGVSPEAVARPLAAVPSAVAVERSLAVWQGSLDAWREFPILGSGLGTFPDAFRRVQPRGLTGLVDTAQSDFFQILVTGGAVGAGFALVGFLSLLVVLLRACRAQRHREESAIALAGIGALLALGLDGLAEFNLGAPAVPATLACVVGLAVAAASGSARDPSRTGRPA